MEGLGMVLIHPEMRAVDAMALAEQMGCRIVWRGSGFFLQRITLRPLRNGTPRPLHRTHPVGR